MPPQSGGGILGLIQDEMILELDNGVAERAKVCVPLCVVGDDLR
jgi:hypothetical protein